MPSGNKQLSVTVVSSAVVLSLLLYLYIFIYFFTIFTIFPFPLLVRRYYGCVGCLVLRLQGSFPPVTVTVFLILRQRAATTLS